MQHFLLVEACICKKMNIFCLFAVFFFFFTFAVLPIRLQPAKGRYYSRCYMMFALHIAFILYYVTQCIDLLIFFVWLLVFPDNYKHATDVKCPSEAKCETHFLAVYFSSFSIDVFIHCPCVCLFLQVMPFEYPPQNIPQQTPNVRRILGSAIYLIIVHCINWNWLNVVVFFFLAFRFPPLMPAHFHPRTPCPPSSRTSPPRQARYFSVERAQLIRI